MIDNKLRMLFCQSISAILYQQSFMMNYYTYNLVYVILLSLITGGLLYLIFKE